MKGRVEAAKGIKLHTRITRTCGHFTRAEGYHQKYMLQQNKALVRSITLAKGEKFEDSPLATKLNGYENNQITHAHTN